MRKIALCAAVAALALPAFSMDISLVKTIDLSANTPSGTGAIKDVIADVNGNLFYTTYFGDPTHTIRKITDPLGVATVTDPWSVGATYPTSSGSYLATDGAGNIYLTNYTVVADAFVRKYRPDGTLDPTFGTAGVAGPFNISGVDHRPRAITYTGAATNKLVMMSFKGAPLQLFSIDATTGAFDTGVVATPGDPTENGLNTGNDMWSGIAYDPVANALYGNSQGDLVKLTGASASLTNLATFDTTTFLTRHGRRNTDDGNLAFDATSGIIAYSARQNAAALQDQRYALYEIATGRETLVGDVPGQPNNISGYTAVEFFRSAGNLYLVAPAVSGKSLKIFAVNTTPAPAPSWVWDKRIDITPVIPTGARAKNLDADSAGNIYFSGYYAAAQIYKITNPAGAASVAVWQTDSILSSSNNVVTLDDSNNVYIGYQGADAATSYIKKYSPAGTLVAAFGTVGTLSPVVINGAGVRPRSIAYTNGKLVVSPFTGAPVQIGVIDAITGADGGVMIDSPGNQPDTASLSGTELWQGAVYDASSQTLYGNAMGSLIKITGAAPTLANLATFDTPAAVVLNKRTASDNYWLKADPTGRWIAFSSYREYTGTPINYTVKTGIIELATGKVEYVGGEPGANGNIDENGSPVFIKSGTTQYLATLSQRDNAVDLWRFDGTAGVNDWCMY